jgi:adenosylmethionine-8-amino-7-oxononanoate aminotransferase
MQVLTHLPIQHLRHQGMIHAFDVHTHNPQFARDCYAAGLANGLLLRPIGNTVYFMPPYVLSTDDIDWLIAQTALAVKHAI